MSDWQTPDPVTVFQPFSTIDGQGYSYEPSAIPIPQTGPIQNFWPNHALPGVVSGVSTDRWDSEGANNRVVATSNAPNVSYWRTRRKPGEFRSVFAAPVLPAWAQGLAVEFEDPHGRVLHGTATCTLSAAIAVGTAQGQSINPDWVGKSFTAYLRQYSTVPAGFRPTVTDLNGMSVLASTSGLTTDESSFGFGRAYGTAETSLVANFSPEDYEEVSPGNFRPTLRLVADMNLFRDAVPAPSLDPATPSGQGSIDVGARISISLASFTYQPPRWRLLHSGQWRTRQRQGVGADGWPVRQRQNYGATGSWSTRQRQNRR